MKWRCWAAVLLILIATIPAAANYTGQDLWIIEIIVNQDLSNSYVTDALITGQQVCLPLSQVTSIMKIPLNTDHERGVYSFTRPGDLVPVILNWQEAVLQFGEEDRRSGQEMYMVNGEIFLPIERLGEMVDAELQYVEQHLAVYLNTAHLEKKEGKRDDKKQTAQKKEKEDIPMFSISNINYRWTIEWEKSCRQFQVVNANPDGETPVGGGRDDQTGNPDDEAPDAPDQPGETPVKTTEQSYLSMLQTDIKGTVYKWDYWFQGQFFKDSTGPFTAELSKYVLTYDMDRAHFYIGSLNVLTEKELPLKKSAYNGVSLVSRVSPLYRMNGNLISVVGEAPQGTKVKIYVNNWFIRELVVKEDGQYRFEDILLSCSESVNEVKVWMKTPDGETEELYRYISVSDAVLNKGEVDYLVQAGKFKADAETANPGNYLWNSIVYWGITDQTTLGLSWYGEMKANAASVEELLAYNYNSLRLNQRLNDHWLARGMVYHIFGSGAGQKDLGYNLQLDYKDANTQFGVEYHRQAKNFKNTSAVPYQIYRAYVIQNIDPRNVLEGTASLYRSLAHPDERQQHYDLAYKVSGTAWDSQIYVARDVYDQSTDRWQNSISASLAYLIRPNLKLLQDVKYKTVWDRFLTKELGAGVEGIYEYKDHTWIAGIDWTGNLTDQRSRTSFSLSWSKLWELGQNQHISTGLGYEFLLSSDDREHSIPLSLQYNYILPNDAKLQLYYQGKWNAGTNKSEVNHKIGLQLEGAFNFFNGKLVSTSPHSNGNQVGIVSGFVFRDSNRNGQFDEGELPLPGITVLLGRKSQVTNAEGKFCFKEIQHGVHLLGFDYAKLPIQLTPSTADKNVKVSANTEIYEPLGLYVVGAADGMIRVKNLPTDFTLRGIKLVAAPGDYTVYTDRRGYYYFDQIPPGTYQIRVDPASLPEWIAKEPVDSRTVVITESGEYIGGINFEFRLIPELLNPQETAIEDLQVIVIPSAEAPEPPVAETAAPQNGDAGSAADGLTATAGTEGQRSAMEPAPENPVPATIDGLEDRLLEIQEDLLTVDLSRQSAVFNGTSIALDPFFLRDEKLWAPIRTIAKLFGCRVFWDPQKQMIYIVDQDKNILFDVQMGYAMVNGVQHPLVDGIRLINDYTFVTLDELGLLGLVVDVQDDMITIQREK